VSADAEGGGAPLRSLLAALERRWGAAAFVKLRVSSVLVAGCGGLGSNVALCLARAGIGFLALYDFDQVEAANLDRQLFFADQVGRFKAEALAENVRRVGAGTEVATFTVRIEEWNVEAAIASADVVVEAFDNPSAKALLVAAAVAAGKTIVAASGVAGLCGASFPRIRLIGGRMALVGDERNEVSDSLPAVSSRVSACAALQADLTLQWITEGRFGKNGN